MTENTNQAINLSTIEEKKDSLWSLIKTILFFVILFYLIRWFIFVPFIVWGTSMEPALQHGNYLIVDRSPRFRTPQLEEIIIFKNPLNPNENLVKRITRKKIKNSQYLFWVLGDNRAHSIDSRNFGYVEENYIIGRVFLRAWPSFTLDL